VALNAETAQTKPREEVPLSGSGHVEGFGMLVLDAAAAATAILTNLAWMTYERRTNMTRRTRAHRKEKRRTYSAAAMVLLVFVERVSTVPLLQLLDELGDRLPVLLLALSGSHLLRLAVEVVCQPEVLHVPIHGVQSSLFRRSRDDAYHLLGGLTRGGAGTYRRMVVFRSSVLNQSPSAKAESYLGSRKLKMATSSSSVQPDFGFVR
jgi:hypothetical protein